MTDTLCLVSTDNVSVNWHVQQWHGRCHYSGIILCVISHDLTCTSQLRVKQC